MKVLVSKAGHSLAIQQQPEPLPRPGEIVLRLLACGLCGTDLHKIAGDTHVGRVLGHEVVGEVVACGDGVARFQIGDRVAAPHHLACGHCRLCLAGIPTRCEGFRREQLDPGGFAERIRVGADATRESALCLPDHMPLESAVFLEPAACVLRGIERASLPELGAAGLELSSVVLGAGSMGLLHLLILRAILPQMRIVVSEPDPWRREQAVRLGADAAVTPEDLGQTIERGYEGGVDAAFDTVGAPVLLEPTARLLRSGGTLVLFAHPGDGDVGPLPDALFSEERRLVGTYSGSVDEQRTIFDLLVAGHLDPRPLITHRLPLERAAEALELARQPRALKILMVPA